jgi:hypothetical protein
VPLPTYKDDKELKIGCDPTLYRLVDLSIGVNKQNSYPTRMIDSVTMWLMCVTSLKAQP